MIIIHVFFNTYLYINMSPRHGVLVIISYYNVQYPIAWRHWIIFFKYFRKLLLISNYKYCSPLKLDNHPSNHYRYRHYCPTSDGTYINFSFIRLRVN